MVANAWKVTDSTATNEHDGVLLEVVSFTADVGSDFLAVRKANPGDLSECRVRLLRGHCANLQAHATTLRTGIKVPALGLHLGCSAGLADKLVNSRHAIAPKNQVQQSISSGPSGQAVTSQTGSGVPPEGS